MTPVCAWIAQQKLQRCGSVTPLLVSWCETCSSRRVWLRCPCTARVQFFKNACTYSTQPVGTALMVCELAAQRPSLIRHSRSTHIGTFQQPAPTQHKLSPYCCCMPHAEPSSPSTCLQEVVAVLRQGSRYEPPSEARVLRSLQQQVDYLGLTAPTVSPVQHTQLASTEISSYRHWPCNAVMQWVQ